MHLTFLFLSWSAHGASAISRRAPAGIAVTNNVLELTTVPYVHHLIPPSSKHLARRRNTKRNARRRDDPIADIQDDLLTLGGRVYMVNATMGGKTYTFVIDTGSSDTWIASSTFVCKNPYRSLPDPNEKCGFGPSYNSSSTSLQPIDFRFAVNYSGGEFLRGTMGTEDFGFGDTSQGRHVSVKQVIGVVDEGYWMGDGISSGLMGLGFSALARGVYPRALNYTSVLYTLFAQPSITPMFSLALRRSTTTNPRAGGLLAIGGMPDIAHDGNWVEVPIQPAVQGVYAWYQIGVDGFNIIPPTTSSTPSPTPNPGSTSWLKRLIRPSASSSSLPVAPSPSLPHPSTSSVPASPKRQSNSNPYKDYRTSLIIDSGTSLIYLPDRIAAYVAGLFEPPARYDSRSGTYLVRCNAKAPRVGIIIGGKTFWISEHDLMNRGPRAVGGSSVGAGDGECAIAIQPAEDGSFVLGDAWMNNVLVVFDVANATDWGVGGSDGKGDGSGSVKIVGREVY